MFPKPGFVWGLRFFPSFTAGAHPHRFGLRVYGSPTIRTITPLNPKPPRSLLFGENGLLVGNAYVPRPTASSLASTLLRFSIVLRMS